MDLSQKQAIFAQNVAHFILYIAEQGYSCTFGEAFRTVEQAALYAKEGKGITDSLHCKRLAVDLNLFDENGKYVTSENPMYRCIGTYWNFMHKYNRWGGDFCRKDLNHFEMQDLNP